MLRRLQQEVEILLTTTMLLQLAPVMLLLLLLVQLLEAFPLPRLGVGRMPFDQLRPVGAIPMLGTILC